MIERIVLRKVKNSEELVLDKVSTPDYILGSVDWGVATGTHHSYKYVNQVGESITNTTLGMRDIIIEGWVVARDEKQMTELKRKLNAFINPMHPIDLLYSKYKINFIPNESVRYSIDVAENNDVFSKFQINGICPNPLFSDNFESRSTFVTTEPTFHFPLIISESLPEGGVVFGKRTDSLIVNLVNNGSVSVGMRIVFKANGTIKNPSLVNVNTQEKLSIDKTMVAGEEIEVNTNVGQKSVKGKIGNGPSMNYFMYKNVDSPWIQLDVGDNLFRYDAEDGLDNLEVFVYFSNQYLEVQECY